MSGENIKPNLNRVDKTLMIDGFEWQYSISGLGEKILLMLPGGTRRPGMRGKLFEELAVKYRIISPTYPLICQMKPLVDGINAILEKETMTNVNVFGASFGGLVAQFLLKEHPGRLSNVILSNTGTKVENPKVTSMKWFQTMIRFVPDRLVRKVVKRIFMKGIPFPEDEKAYYGQFLYQSFSKKVLLCHFSCLIDFQTHFSIDSLEYEQWNGELLIISAKDDTFVGKESIANLHALFPNAEFYTFDTGGHVLNLTHFDKYYQLITEFLG